MKVYFQSLNKITIEEADHDGKIYKSLGQDFEDYGVTNVNGYKIYPATDEYKSALSLLHPTLMGILAEGKIPQNKDSKDSKDIVAIKNTIISKLNIVKFHGDYVVKNAFGFPIFKVEFSEYGIEFLSNDTKFKYDLRDAKIEDILSKVNHHCSLGSSKIEDLKESLKNLILIRFPLWLEFDYDVEDTIAFWFTKYEPTILKIYITVDSSGYKFEVTNLNLDILHKFDDLYDFLKYIES